MEEKVLNCRPKIEFQIEELLGEMERHGLLDEDQHLLKFLRRLGPDFLIEEVRTLYYDVGLKRYDEWLEDEESSRVFWSKVSDAIDEAAYKLTPDSGVAIDNAAHGAAGRELFAHVVTWFLKHSFIRTDFTKWGCRLFRYLDSYGILEASIMGKIFSEHYEDIQKIETIFVNVVHIIHSRLPYFEVIVLEKQIDIEEYMFEGGAEIVPSAWEEELLDAAHNNLRSLEPLIYDAIFPNG